MNILAISDMHGDLTCVQTLLAGGAWDLVLCCGDWGDPGQLTRDDYERLLDFTPLYTVYGNHDDIPLLGDLRNHDGSPVLLTSGQVVEVAGFRLMGVSGIWAKSHRLPWYVTDEDVLAYGQDGERVDVIVTHGCGIGLNDLTPSNTRGGQRCFSDLFGRLQPQVYICGHLHRAQVRRLKSGPWVANVGYTAEGDYLAIATPPGDWQVEQGRVDLRRGRS